MVRIGRLVLSGEKRLAFTVMFESSKQKSGSTLDTLIVRAETGSSRGLGTLGKETSLFGGVGLSASDVGVANGQKRIHKMNNISK